MKQAVTLKRSATSIQAAYRGHISRKSVINSLAIQVNELHRAMKEKDALISQLRNDDQEKSLLIDELRASMLMNEETETEFKNTVGEMLVGDETTGFLPEVPRITKKSLLNPLKQTSDLSAFYLVNKKLSEMPERFHSLNIDSPEFSPFPVSDHDMYPSVFLPSDSNSWCQEEV